MTNVEKKQAKKLANPIKSVGMKLFAIIFCGIIACVMSVGLLAYSKAKEIIESKVSEASFQTVNQVANNLDIIFRTYEDLSMQIMIDEDFHEQVRTVLDSRAGFKKSEAAGKLNERLRNYVTGNVSISGVMLIPLNPKLTVLNVGTAQANRSEIIKESAWFKEVIERDGKTLWIPPQPGGWPFCRHRRLLA